jgi:epoxyqueuosine reductase
MDTLEARIKARARELGFDPVGIAPASPADDFERLRAWLARGFAGEMDYLPRLADARRHPSAVLPEVRSVVMVGMSYEPGVRSQESGVRNQGSGVRGQGSGVREGGPAVALTPDSCLLTPVRGRVARYARGPDYHDVLRGRLKQLLAWLCGERPECRGRCVVDTAPLLERDFARRAGLGWVGKNTMLISKRLGSYLFLGALLVDLELAADEPFTARHCGTCTACLDACPTQAFAGPYQLDARRCVSYLTIELRHDVPEELRPGLGDWVFGCDVCQEVCPWNRKAPTATSFPARADLVSLDPVELLGLSAEEFRRRFGGTALTRPGRAGLLRNAALVLGNRGDAAALPALRRALDDAEPLVREAARWAVARIEERQGTPDVS